MTATATESTNFLWHCEVIALLTTALPYGTSRNSNIAHALRKATSAAIGSKGVRHASRQAREHQAERNAPWSECGLVREHVIPVGFVGERVREALTVLPDGDADAALRRVPSPLAPGLWSRRGLHIAEVVLDWTLLAWITPDEDVQLRKRGLGSRMPTGWDGQNRFARYDACGILHDAI